MLLPTEFLVGLFEKTNRKKMIKQINHVPIVLHSMDSYHHYWDNWYFLFKKHCFNHGPIYFLTEERKPSFVDEVIHVKTGSGEWGFRLLEGLKSVNSELMIYMQEDFWPKKDLLLCDDMLSLFYNKNMECLKINNIVKEIRTDQIDGELYKVQQNSPYSLTHQFSIWNLNFFRNLVLPHENPWANEIDGSKRMNQKPHNIYYIAKEWYAKVCSRGVLNEHGHRMLKSYDLEFHGAK
jgi:hypothetical protein